MSNRYLKIYLNDHLAGAVAGVELAKRIAGNNKGTEFEAEIESLRNDIEEDRDELMRLMNRLDIPQNPIKQPASWLAEKVGRLKLNGRLTGYSPLSRVVELVGLSLGVEGKAGMWRSLKKLTPALGEVDESWLGSMLTKAMDQRERVEKLRLRAVEILAEEG
jgi:hypothetical protein